MQVLLDDGLLMGIFSDVAAALEAGRVKAEEQGRVIIDVILDGEVVSEEDLSRMCVGESQATPETVQLNTADPIELTRTVLEQAEEALGQAVQLQAKVGEMLQSGEVSDAMGYLTAPMELWGQVYQAVVQCALLLGVDLAEVKAGGEPADQIVGGLAEQLRQVRDALVSEDQVALADEFSYELADTADRWETLIQVMREHVAAAAAGR